MEGLDTSGFAAPEDYAHLRVPPTCICWWCRERQATTGEHKFKKTDLAQLMGPDQTLLWGNGTDRREIRGKSGITRDRYGVVKFPKSMCEKCNNVRSKPFDQAYEKYSAYLHETALLRKMPGLDFSQIYGEDWQKGAINLARYHAKHFACRLARVNLPIPSTLPAFLNGEEDMQDAQMALITTDSVHKEYGKGLSISPDFVSLNKEFSRFESITLISYIGSIGVRYHWVREGISNRSCSQFFHYPVPVINCFRTELDAIQGIPRRPGWFARLCQWANQPR